MTTSEDAQDRAFRRYEDLGTRYGDLAAVGDSAAAQEREAILAEMRELEGRYGFVKGGAVVRPGAYVRDVTRG